MAPRPAPWPPRDLDEATVATRELTEASRELAGRLAKVMEMNATDMTAVAILGLDGPLGATDLATRLGIRTASATALIDRLERSGHVERVRDTDDRRRVTVTVTAAARRAERTAWAGIIGDIDAIGRSLTNAERAVVLDFLTRVTEVTRVAGRDWGRVAGPGDGFPLAAAGRLTM